MNKPTWEKFEGRPHTQKRSSEVRVTIGKVNVIYLNQAAHDALGSPRAVELMYDGNRRIIGLKPCDPTRRNAFPIFPQGNSGTYHRIQASAFCQHFRLKTRETLLFNPIDIDNDGIMTLGLNDAITVGRGAR